MEIIGTITKFGTGRNNDCGSLITNSGDSYGFNLNNIIDAELHALLINKKRNTDSIIEVLFTPDVYVNRIGYEKKIANSIHLKNADNCIVNDKNDIGYKNGTKHFLSTSEQINHMKKQGILFDQEDYETAFRALTSHSNYFRLRSFRNGFKKTLIDDFKVFDNLKFSTLYELYLMDNLFREVFLELTLDIENAAKLALLHKAEEFEDDPYRLVNNYLNEKSIDTISGKLKGIDIATIEDNKDNNPYIGGLIEKYKVSGYPIWAFLELLTFGNFNYFYIYSAVYFNDSLMKDNFYLLQVVKNLRNACAHGNCILNDLGLIKQRQKINRRVENMIRILPDINLNDSLQLMNNQKVHQIITTLYAHFVFCNQEIYDQHIRNLLNIRDRLTNQLDCYSNGNNNQMFRFTKLFNAVIDSLIE